MEKVLIIEDEQDIRETLQDILEMAGYAVRTAKNGRVGFDEIMEHQPDLVLCDVNMPELDGFELLGAVNQRMANGIVPPFLFLTAKVEKQDIRHGMSLGADDYILKPFDHNELLDIIKLRLDKRKKLLQQGNSIPTNGSAMVSFEKIALPSAEGLELIPFDNIIKCQADRAYCEFHVLDGNPILVSKPMREFEDVLLQKGFLKVHKSTIINVKYVEQYIRGKGGLVKMVDGSVVSVSATNKEALMKMLNPGH